MTDIFLIKLVLTFLVGSIWVTLITIAAERFGTKLGGAIAGIPSTVLVSLFFIGYTQSPEIASQTTTIIPYVLGCGAVFVVVYVLLVKFNFYLSIISALLTWLVLTLSFVFFNVSNFMYSLIVFFVLFALSYYILEKRLDIKAESGRNIKYSPLQLLFRGFLSGSIITFAVFIAKIGGPLLGGVFAAFPALMLSTILIVHFAHGKDFSSALMKIIMISGSVNLLVYTVSVRYSYLYFGLLSGTLIAFVISLISGYFVYLFINKKIA